MADKKEIGIYIKEQRKLAKMTQKELAKRIDKVESTVRMWELGKNMPSPDSLGSIAGALNIPYDHLMFHAGYIKELPNYDWLIKEDHSSYQTGITVDIPSRISLKDANGAIGTKVARNNEELKSWLFDLRYLLNLQIDLFYNKNILSIKEKEDIEKFIRELIKRKE